LHPSKLSSPVNMAQSFDQFPTLDDLGDFAPILNTRPDILVLVTLFRALPPHDVETIAHYMRAYIALEDTVVFNEGEIGDTMLFIVEGMVRVCRGDPADGATLGILDRGKTFGEMALIDNMPRSATCVVLHDSMFAALTRANFERLSQDHPSLAIAVLKEVARMLSSRLRHANETREGGMFDFLELQ
jgi:CRP/FNR family transcriptional regulator, cyclic AMP receptor protein